MDVIGGLVAPETGWRLAGAGVIAQDAEFALILVSALAARIPYACALRTMLHHRSR